MSHQIIYQDDKPVFVVVPYDEWIANRTGAEDADDAEDLAALHDALQNDDGRRYPIDVIKRLSASENPLKVYREHASMTQEELAALVDVTKTYIGQIERGERSMSDRLRGKLAATLNLDISDLTPWPQD